MPYDAVASMTIALSPDSDVGNIYSPSCIPAYRLTDEERKQSARAKNNVVSAMQIRLEVRPLESELDNLNWGGVSCKHYALPASISLR
jgi:hypothetical protein